MLASFDNPEECKYMRLGVREQGTGGCPAGSQKIKKQNDHPTSGIWYPLPGDIVLFEDPKDKLVSKFISMTTKSRWTHSGMICTALITPVRTNDIYAPASAECDAGTNGKHWETVIGGERVLLFEVTTDLDPIMWDFTCGRKASGVRAVDAYQRLHAECIGSNRDIMVRRIEPYTPKLKDAIVQIQKKFYRHKYNWYPPNMAAPLCKGAHWCDEEKKVAELSGRAICSQLVAEVLIAAEILPAQLESRFYSPADFDVGGFAEMQIVKKGYRLTDPIFLSF